MITCDHAKRDCEDCPQINQCKEETRANLANLAREKWGLKPHTRPTITEEPIPARIKPIICAETEQRNRFKLRDQK